MSLSTGNFRSQLRSQRERVPQQSVSTWRQMHRRHQQVHLSMRTRLYGNPLRNEHQRMRIGPLRQRRCLHGSGQRIPLRMPAWLL